MPHSIGYAKPQVKVHAPNSEAVHVTGMRRARYRGLDKTRLEHANAAVALNLIRLHAWWNGHPLDRTRTSHLARLELALAS
jgi:Transposase DDE domain